MPLRAESTIAATTPSAISSATTKMSMAFGRKRDSKTRPAVLVRDATLAAVADRLDHGHADVSGLLLDRVDHRLDALADDHCLDLDHCNHLRFVVPGGPVPPAPSSLADSLAHADDAEAARGVQPQAGAVFSGKIAVWIVQMPARSLVSISSVQQRAPDPAALPVACDVDARLDDAA